MIKAAQGNLYSYALAEFYDMSPDFKVATVRLREGLKFHNADPVTAEDVKFTYENYHGINAPFLHEKTERVEIVDQWTVRIHFKEPFLDFLMYYGTTASAAGVISPITTTCPLARTLKSGTRSSRRHPSEPVPTTSRVRSPASRWSSLPLPTTGARTRM